MGHFLHGATCRSWIYDWSCPECTSPIAVYQCTCGSGLFFDHKGPPWPKHDCGTAIVAKAMAAGGAWLKASLDPKTGMASPFADSLAGYVAHGVMEPGKAFENGGDEQGISAKPAAPFDIKAMDPMAGEVESFIGVLRAKVKTTGKVSALYASLGDIGRKAMGLPSKSDALQITIERNDDVPVESYTGVVHRALAEGIGSGDLVWVTYEARSAGMQITWVVTELQALD